MYKYSISITFLFTLWFPFAYGQAPTLESGNEILTSRVAPGESIPVMIKLINFGNTDRVDVIINYYIYSPESELIVKETETVAVETTAQFVRPILLPFNLKPGLYTVESDILYPDQESPAISSFTFSIEPKYFGVFRSTWVVYGQILFVFTLFIVITTFLISRRKRGAALLHDYSDVPSEQQMYYEIISDVVTQMRLSVGARAIDLAQSVKGLELNPRSGKVTALNAEPAEIVSELISLFEKKYGSRINISFEQGRESSRVIIK